MNMAEHNARLARDPVWRRSVALAARSPLARQRKSDSALALMGTAQGRCRVARSMRGRSKTPEARLKWDNETVTRLHVVAAELHAGRLSRADLFPFIIEDAATFGVELPQ